MLNKVVEQLLAHAIPLLPLTRAGMSPQAKVSGYSAAQLFPHARAPEAALAGLALQVGDWEAAHSISQDIHTREGSYWHAIVHRLEPDYWNSNYWFREVGKHPIFSSLADATRAILTEQAEVRWRLSGAWDPARFNEWVREAIDSHDDAKTSVARRIQAAEIGQLWSFCVQAR